MTGLDFDPDLERLGKALHASTTVDLAQEHQAAQATTPEPRRARLRRPPLLAGGTLGLAGIGAALVLAFGGTAATTPAFAITKDANGVLVHLNYTSDQNLPQVDAKLASMGIHESVGIQMAPGAATASGPVLCAKGPGANTRVRVLVGANGTETIAAGQSAGNTAQGSFHLVSCSTSSDTDAGNTGNS